MRFQKISSILSVSVPLSVSVSLSHLLAKKDVKILESVTKKTDEKTDLYRVLSSIERVVNL